MCGNICTYAYVMGAADSPGSRAPLVYKCTSLILYAAHHVRAWHKTTSALKV